MTLKGSSVFKNEITLAISILLIATCLRAPFTSMGPLLETIQASLHLSTAAAVWSMPCHCWHSGTVSPLVPWIARRLGLERAMGLALVLTGCGIVLRSFGTIWSLFAGTVVLGCGIAVCNVLLRVSSSVIFPIDSQTDGAVCSDDGGQWSIGIGACRSPLGVSGVGLGMGIGNPVHLAVYRCNQLDSPIG